MFLHLKNSIPKKIEQLGIKKQINTVNICRKAEFIICKNLNLNNRSASGIIKSLKFKNKTLYLTVDNFYILNEIKLKEQLLKNKLREDGLDVNSIKYTS